MTTTTGADTQRRSRDERLLLQIYLNDHRSGAAGGLALARRSSDANRDSPLGETLEWLVAQIEQDADSLDGVMRHLGARSNPVKQMAVAVGERVGRLKLNGRLRGYSPLSRVLEIEGLMAGVTVKRRLWETLREITGGDDVGGADLAELVARADTQLERLSGHHPDAVRTAFGA